MIEIELKCFTNWAKEKNLVVNDTKSKFMICLRNIRESTNFHKLKASLTMECVQMMNILGVQVDAKLKFNEHIDTVIKKSYKSFYLIRMLKQYHLDNHSCRDLFMALCVSHLLYAALAWYHFMRVGDHARIEHIFKRALKCGYLTINDPSVQQMIQNHATKLFKNISMNANHILYQLLPPVKECQYDLCMASHNFTLPQINYPFDNRNFIVNMLYLKL